MGGRNGSTGIRMRRAMLPVLFFAFTVGVSIPSEIFFGNEKEFSVGYPQILPLILAVTAVLFAAAAGIAFLLRKQKRLLPVWLDLLFGGTLAVYLQQNLLNGELQLLDGAGSSPSGTSPLALAALGVWIVCLAGPHILRKIRPRAEALVRRYGSALLTVMQVGALAVMIVSSEGPTVSRFSLTKKDEFTVSPEGNIIVFVVDTLDAQWAEDLIDGQEECREALKDFTFFSNVVGGGAPTIIGMPTLFTGEIYDPDSGSVSHYMASAYQKSSLFSDLRDNGYQVRLYTNNRYLYGADGTEIANSAFNYCYQVRYPKKFVKDLYRMTAYKGLPYQLKKPFTVYSEELTGNVLAEGGAEDRFELDDAAFCSEFRKQGLTLSGEKKAFVVYHFFGAHGPYSMNENGKKVREADTSREQQVLGVFRVIAEYLEEMKKHGVYDSSMIVITADHGGNLLYQNPAVFVKPGGARQDALAVSDAPLTFRNLRAGFMEAAAGQRNEAYGDGMFTENLRPDEPRPHTFSITLYRRIYGEEPERKYKNPKYLTLMIGDPARDRNLFTAP